MILDDIVKAKEKRLIESKKIRSLNEIKEEAINCRRESISFFEALNREGLSIIGEFKKASPSMGNINSKIDLSNRIEQYNNSVDAISVLTEEDFFYGSVEYLKDIRNISTLPILRKDFIIDEYQIYEAKNIGADAVLLIAAILEDENLEEYYKLAHSLNLDVLLEVHNEAEMDRALKLDANIIGINNRNLKDFTIDLNTTRKLKKMIPENKVVVSESGVTTDGDILLLKELEVNALLIGRAFMESKNPEALSKRWKNL